MRTATNREPVSVRNASGQYSAVRKGDEFPDDDPIVTAHAWLFEEEGEAPPERLESVPVVEDASARPGSARRGRLR